jgi:hypothetical protein
MQSVEAEQSLSESADQVLSVWDLSIGRVAAKKNDSPCSVVDS